MYVFITEWFLIKQFRLKKRKKTLTFAGHHWHTVIIVSLIRLINTNFAILQFSINNRYDLWTNYRCCHFNSWNVFLIGVFTTYSNQLSHKISTVTKQFAWKKRQNKDQFKEKMCRQITWLQMKKQSRSLMSISFVMNAWFLYWFPSRPLKLNEKHKQWRKLLSP